MILVAALTFHVATKLPVVRRSFREQGVTAHLREDLAHTLPEPESSAEENPKAPTNPDPPTISRRGVLGAVGATSIGLALMVVGQVVRGPFEFLGLLAPRAQDLGDGPQDFQVNKTFAGANIEEGATGASWRLKLAGAGGTIELSRDDLLRMPQATEELPIACVEGWSTTQTWTGVRLRDLARAAGMPAGSELFVESLQQGGAFRTVTLTPNKVSNPRSLLALKVNGEDLAPDHGFPARVIVPALPGVHNTKWVASLTYRAETA
jgi:DMSO/TMAO reductase YedYZ molybdopterin-dependent catalytic subunit